jgi:hypothetical protein
MPEDGIFVTLSLHFCCWRLSGNDQICSRDIGYRLSHGRVVSRRTLSATVQPLGYGRYVRNARTRNIIRGEARHGTDELTQDIGVRSQHIAVSSSVPCVPRVPRVPCVPCVQCVQCMQCVPCVPIPVTRSIRYSTAPNRF